MEGSSGQRQGQAWAGWLSDASLATGAADLNRTFDVGTVLNISSKTNAT